MLNKMILHHRFSPVKSMLAGLLAAVLAGVVFAAPADAEKHQKAAPKPPPLTLEQIKAGIGKNQKAIVDLKSLAQKDNAEAQVFLGDLYMKGAGVFQNFSMAWTWYKRAADTGHAGAQYNLGMMYRQGKGTPLYPDKGLEWLNKAARQGHGAARAFLKSLGVAPPPVEMKKPEEMAEKTAGGKDGKADKPSKKYTAPSVEMLLEGMTPALREAPGDVLELVRLYVKAVNDTDVEGLKKLIAPEYAVCVNDQNRKVYEDYLLRGLRFKISTPYKVAMGDADSAWLPFKNMLTFPVPPAHYVRLDIVRPPPQDAEKIKLNPVVIQFLAFRDGKWSLTLGCPSPEGVNRMRHAFGGAKNG